MKQVRTGQLPFASPLVGQEFPVQDDNDPVSAGIGFPPDFKAEGDRAHDAVTEFPVNKACRTSSPSSSREQAAVARAAVIGCWPTATAVSWSAYGGIRYDNPRR